MADTKVADLTALATVNGNEQLYAVDDPAGTPLDRKVTIDQIKTYVLRFDGARVATQEATTSSTPADLTTAGPAVTVVTGTKAKVTVGAFLSHDTANSYATMGFAVSGGTTVAASREYALEVNKSNANAPHRASVTYLVTGLTAGSNTFTAKYWTPSAAGNASFKDRTILVEDMGS